MTLQYVNMNKTVGRPRTASLDEALLRAAEELLIEEGFGGLKINTLVSRAGTTRPAFYRRYAGVPQLLLALLGVRYGASLHVDTGSLRTDLLEVQREQARMFSDPLVRRSLAGFLDALQENSELKASFVDQFFKPRRTATKDVINRAVSRGEIAPAADPEWICDLLTSPMAMRASFPSLNPIDNEVIEGTVRVALAELGFSNSAD